jgi:hypothetical protein
MAVAEAQACGWFRVVGWTCHMMGSPLLAL